MIKELNQIYRLILLDILREDVPVTTINLGFKDIKSVEDLEAKLIYVLPKLGLPILINTKFEDFKEIDYTPEIFTISISLRDYQKVIEIIAGTTVICYEPLPLDLDNLNVEEREKFFYISDPGVNNINALVSPFNINWTIADDSIDKLIIKNILFSRKDIEEGVYTNWGIDYKSYVCSFIQFMHSAVLAVLDSSKRPIIKGNVIQEPMGLNGILTSIEECIGYNSEVTELEFVFTVENKEVVSAKMEARDGGDIKNVMKTNWNLPMIEPWVETIE